MVIDIPVNELIPNSIYVAISNDRNVVRQNTSKLAGSEETQVHRERFNFLKGGDFAIGNTKLILALKLL